MLTPKMREGASLAGEDLRHRRGGRVAHKGGMPQRQANFVTNLEQTLKFGWNSHSSQALRDAGTCDRGPRKSAEVPAYSGSAVVTKTEQVGAWIETVGCII